MPQHEFFMNAGYPHINPLSFGHGVIHAGDVWGPTINPYWTIHYVLRGYGRFTVNHNTYDVRPGQLFVTPAFAEHKLEADLVNPWEYMWLSFTIEGPLPMALDDVITCPQAQFIFESMKRSEALNAGRAAYMLGRIWRLFSALLESGENHEENYVEKAIEYIQHEYSRGITVQDVANHLNLNRSYLSTLFHKKIGITPSRYILDYRMSIANSLLTQHNKSVSIVATSVGYSDVFSFSKAFKRYFGTSPQAYTKHHNTEP